MVLKLRRYQDQRGSMSSRVYSFAAMPSSTKKDKVNSNCYKTVDSKTGKEVGSFPYVWEGEIDHRGRTGKGHGRSCGEARSDFCAIFGKEGACEGDSPKFVKNVDRTDVDIDYDITNIEAPSGPMGPPSPEDVGNMDMPPEDPEMMDQPPPPPNMMQGMFDSVCKGMKIPFLCENPQNFMIGIAVISIVSFMAMILLMKK